VSGTVNDALQRCFQALAAYFDLGIIDGCREKLELGAMRAICLKYLTEVRP
jgi:hypothetical protein